MATTRGTLWYIKFVLASLGAGFSVYLFLIPFFLSQSGAEFAHEWGALLILFLSLAFAPLVWRKLK